MTKAIRQLQAANGPTSTYPFLFHLLKAVRDGSLAAEAAAQCVNAIESFLVRRSIAGKEPTGLLALFRTAWKNIEHDPNAASFIAATQKRGTIDWPDDDEVRKGVLERNIYRSSVRNFLLSEYDRSLGGDVPAQIPWVEHVLPQDLNKRWTRDFSESQHEALVHTWGNLIPLSKEMNQGLSASQYEKKKAAFESDSMYKSARQLAKNYAQWTPKSIQDRGTAIADWAVLRWPHQPK